MPLYVFHCPRCDTRFEDLAPFGKTIPCPSCGFEKPKLKIQGFVAPRKPALSAVKELEEAPPAQTGLQCEGATRMINCSGHGGKVGLRVGPGAHVVSHGLRVSGAETGIKNEGVLEDTDTMIE
jgi:putative FmdB family regulatory protein